MPSASEDDRPQAPRRPGRLRQIAHLFAMHGSGGVVTLLRYYAVRAATLVSSSGRYCPACGWRGRAFRPMVLYAYRAVRAQALCPGCGAWERHRAAAPHLGRLVRDHFAERSVDIVHFSAEECLAKGLRPYARSYRASSYENPAPGEILLDLHDLALPDEDADLAVMCYVLSCMRDDRLAVRNLWRVLRPGGMVVAIEPFTTHGRHHEWGGSGYGGQWRTFGAEDVASRFAPFRVEIVDLLEGLDAEERHLRGVAPREFALALRKPSG